MQRADRIAVVVLVVLPFAVLAPAFFPGRVLSPLENVMAVFPWRALADTPATPNHELFDPTQYFHPALLYAASEVRAGRFPFWNPYQYTGVPFFSNPQAATLFPLTALAYVLPLPLALALTAALKLAVAGLAMFWFLHVLGVAWTPALVGALGFMLGSQMISWLQWTVSSAVMLFPALFAGVERMRAGATATRTAALATIVALELLAGYPQASFHAALATAAWTLARAPGAARGYVPACAVAGALGAAVAAVQLVPFADYLRESAVYAYRSGWTAPMHIPLETAVTFVLPHFYGAGAERWGVWQFAITTTYVGLVPLLSAPLGALGALREPVSRFFVGMALVAGGIHYGGPLIGTLAGAPGMSLGTNARLMPWLVFAVGTLGALGLHRAGSTGGRVVRGWFAVVAIAVAVCVVASLGEPRARAMRWSLPAQYLVALALMTVAALVMLAWLERRDRGWGAALVACQLGSLLPLAVTYNPVRGTDWFYPTPPAIEWLQQHRTARAVMPGHLGVVYRLPQAHGYDGMTPRRIEEIAGPIGSGRAAATGFVENPLTLWGSEPLSAVAVLRSRVIDLLGVRYVVLPPRVDPGWPDARLVYDGADARIFERAQALPRAFLVGRARCVADGETLALVRGGAVDVRREVVLSGCAAPQPVSEPRSGDTIDLQVTGNDRVSLAVATAGPAYLVVTDTWFPGWRTLVDGVEATTWRADHAFRAVWVPGGRHAVDMTFRPRGFGIALAVSLAALATVVGLALVGARRGDRARA